MSRPPLVTRAQALGLTMVICMELNVYHFFRGGDYLFTMRSYTTADVCLSAMEREAEAERVQDFREVLNAKWLVFDAARTVTIGARTALEDAERKEADALLDHSKAYRAWKDASGRVSAS